MPDYFCQFKVCEIACQSRAFFSANERSKTETNHLRFPALPIVYILFASRYD